ncbi:MAG TPA: type IV pilin [Thermoplasmata archaeon]|nr:type IV pilin [Thermoplasmata archaeon]
MRRKDEGGVSPVIATILMVAITVVLAAVLYVMVSSFIGDGGDRKPIVSTAAGECGTDWCEGSIAGTNGNHALARYKITVLADGVQAIAPTPLAAGLNVSGGGLTLRYTDLGADGILNAGDTIRLSGMQPGVSYRVALLWHDGSELRSLVFDS